MANVSTAGSKYRWLHFTFLLKAVIGKLSARSLLTLMAVA